MVQRTFPGRLAVAVRCLDGKIFELTKNNIIYIESVKDRESNLVPLNRARKTNPISSFLQVKFRIILEISEIFFLQNISKRLCFSKIAKIN